MLELVVGGGGRVACRPCRRRRRPLRPGAPERRRRARSRRLRGSGTRRPPASLSKGVEELSQARRSPARPDRRPAVRRCADVTKPIESAAISAWSASSCFCLSLTDELDGHTMTERPPMSGAPDPGGDEDRPLGFGCRRSPLRGGRSAGRRLTALISVLDPEPDGGERGRSSCLVGSLRSELDPRKGVGRADRHPEVGRQPLRQNPGRSTSDPETTRATPVSPRAAIRRSGSTIAAPGRVSGAPAERCQPPADRTVGAYPAGGPRSEASHRVREIAADLLGLVGRGHLEGARRA